MIFKKKILLIIFLFFPIILFSQIISPPQPKQKGMERIIRQDDKWEWGTCGHGSFDDAVKIFSAEKDVEIYQEGKITYRVFSRMNKNYIEMSTGWSVYTYTTYKDSDISFNQHENNTTEQTISLSTIKDKVTRKPGNWEWGTYDHGNFDQASRILKETQNIVKFIDSNNPKIKYRVFTHATLNFVEINYGWNGGIFEYTTNNR